jgi:patatin-like phospholipase/acyl hydrolase
VIASDCRFLWISKWERHNDRSSVGTTSEIDRSSRSQGPRKLLAIDGGGIRGVLSLMILDKIEKLLIEESKREDYRLADYFDYVSGTSTGGIIAAGIAMGMSVTEILAFYVDNGAKMFDKASIIRRLQYQYKSEPLALQLQKVFGEETTLGAPELETLLLLVMRNATTDSPWPISNNPYAKYNDAKHGACNLHFPLWQLVRASTAAPAYFPPEVIDCGGKPFIFVDGGVTMYNNPAFQMFLMATVDRYWAHAPADSRGWKTGVDDMLMVSIGTGTSAGENYSLRPEEMNLIFNATKIPSALMYAALNEQDFLCRVFGDCVSGPLLDREVDNMIDGARSRTSSSVTLATTQNLRARASPRWAAETLNQPACRSWTRSMHSTACKGSGKPSPRKGSRPSTSISASSNPLKRVDHGGKRAPSLLYAHKWALRHPRGAPAVTAAQQTFLGASRAAEIDWRRRRRLLRLVLAMIVAVGMGYVGWSNRSYLAAS